MTVLHTLFSQSYSTAYSDVKFGGNRKKLSSLNAAMMIITCELSPLCIGLACSLQKAQMNFLANPIPGSVIHCLI